MKRGFQRFLSLTIAMIMVLGLFPVNALAASSWEEDNAYLDVLNGEITHGELYDKLVELFGAEPAKKTDGRFGIGNYTGVFKYNANVVPEYSWNLGGTAVQKGGSSDVGLSHNTLYYVARQSGIASFDAAKSITVRHYYAPSIAVAADSDTTASVSVSPSKAYAGSTVTLAVPNLDGYSVVVKDGDGDIVSGNSHVVNSKNDAKFTVTYTEAASIGTVGASAYANGSLTIGDTALSSGADLEVEAGKYTVTATPKDGYYVKKLSVDGGTVAVYSGTVASLSLDVEASKEYAITVEFAKAGLAVKDADVKINFFPAKEITSDRFNDYNALAEKIFDVVVDQDASVPSTLKYTDGCTVQFLSTRALSDDVWRNLDFDAPTGIQNALAPGYGYSEFPVTVDDTARVKITWPAKGIYPAGSAEASIKLVEEREAASISFNQSEPIVFETEDDIVAGILAIATSDSSKEITAVYVSGTLPSGGESAVLRYRLSVEEDDENVLAASKEVEVSVKAKENPANINISIVGNGTVTIGTLSESGSLYAGTYAITGTPGDAAGYLSGITVNGEPFSGNELTVENDKTYLVEFTFTIRRVTANDGAAAPYNPYKLDGWNAIGYPNYPNELIAAVYSALLGENAEGATISVNTILGWRELGTLTYSALSLGENTVRVTLPASGIMPSVTEEFTVNLYDERKDSGLTGIADLGNVDFVNDDEIDAFIQTAEGTYNPNGLSVKYALADGSSVPSECNVPTELVCIVSFDGNAEYKAGSAEIGFTATRKAAMCTIVADSTLGEYGSLSGAGNVDGLTETTVTVTPKTGYAVESITILGSDNTTQTPAISYNDRKASVSFTTGGENGSVTYTVKAEYSAVSLAAKDGA
ncbi:MAG: hypothetical protein E7328_05965, partial [Clostridiales bacterium]|nr:hypothetical protein [Clostridiales bacterium]